MIRLISKCKLTFSDNIYLNSISNAGQVVVRQKLATTPPGSRSYLSIRNVFCS